MMKKFLLMGFLIASLFQNPSGLNAAHRPSEAPVSILSVDGVGSLEVEPDIALMTLGVVTENQSPTLIQEINAKTMNKVKESLSKLGIADKDIKTSNYNLSPEYSYENNQSKLKGYQLTHLLLVKIRNLKQVGAVISKTSQAGANKMEDIIFDIEHKEDIVNQAINKALKNAEKLAYSMAESMKMHVVKVLRISHSDSRNNFPPEPFVGASLRAGMVGAEAPNIQKGSLNIVANVSVDFIID